jgi:hypothetical protein
MLQYYPIRGWKFKSSSKKQVIFTAKVFTLQEGSVTLQGNVSEMSLYFNMLSSYTIDDAGAKPVVIKTSGYEKIQVTAMVTELRKPCVLPTSVMLE